MVMNCRELQSRDSMIRKKLACEVAEKESGKTTMTRKVRAFFAKFQAR